MKKNIFILIALLVSCSVQASLKWTQDGGWTSQGGIAELFFDNTQEAKTGIQLMNKAREYQEKGDYSKALSCYKKVYTRYSTSLLAPQALFQEAEIYVIRHQYGPAFSAYDKIIKQYSDFSEFNTVILKQFEVACLLMDGNRPYYWGVIPGFKDYDAAIKYFEKIVDTAPFIDIAPQALMNIAKVAKEHGKPEQVIDALERLIYIYPQSPLAEEGYLLIADTYASLVKGPDYDQAPTRKAYEYYEDFLSYYPSSTQVSHAENGSRKMIEILAKSKYILGDFYYKYRNNPKAALTFYNDTLTIDPHSLTGQKAKKNVQKIKDKVPPPPTVVDIIFGRYEELQYEEETL